MKPTTYEIKLRVFIPEMMKFFKDDARVGSREKPYPADMFFELLSPYAHFYGPLRNILVFKENALYVWSVESSDGKKMKFSTSEDVPEMELEMITDDPSDEKWKKIFRNVPEMQPDGKLKIKSSDRSSNKFIVETSNELKEGGKLKYSFMFEFEDSNGVTKYRIIDPVGDCYPPPPPPQ